MSLLFSVFLKSISSKIYSYRMYQPTPPPLLAYGQNIRIILLFSKKYKKKLFSCWIYVEVSGLKFVPSSLLLNARKRLYMRKMKHDHMDYKHRQQSDTNLHTETKSHLYIDFFQSLSSKQINSEQFWFCTRKMAFSNQLRKR